MLGAAALCAGLSWSGISTRPAQDPVRVPAFTAYFQPDPDQGPRREKDGRLTGWNAATKLQWFGRLNATGELNVGFELAEVAPANAKLRLSLGRSDEAELLHVWDLRVVKGDSAVQVPADRATVSREGYYRFRLECADAAATKLPALKSLVLGGPASVGAQFSDIERRNASSVHLGYPVPGKSKDEIEWFYIEITPKTDPLYSYYMATGFSRGYFGMQVNSASERRLIFSVWDAGNEAVDRSKVAESDRVKLLATGEHVVASGFGNEGTGGHSHLQYAWKLGGRFRFLVRAAPGAVEEATTTYTAWFFFPETKSWGLIASFQAPRDGKFLRGLYSFNENFGGSTGEQRRLCEFGNGWVRTRSGTWLSLDKATFTHDGHGEKQRLDRSAGVIDGRFYLANGGFVDDLTPGAVTRAYDKLELKSPVGEHPSDAQLEALVKALGD